LSSTETTWTADGETKATNSTSTNDSLSIDGTLTVGGASQLNSTLTVGVDDTGYDVKFFGATSGQYMLWDESADELVLAGDSKLSFHDAAGGENIIATSNGHLEINAGTTLDITAPTVDVNVSSELNIDGNVDLNGTLDVSSTSTLTGLVTASAGIKLGNNIIYASDGGATITLDTSDNVTIGNNLKVGGNVIQASDGGSKITMATSDNITIAGNLTVNGTTGMAFGANNSILLVTASAHDTAGRSLSLVAGDTTAGTTNNIAGGNVNIQGGQGKGTGVGGNIVFSVANAGSSGSSLNSTATAMTINYKSEVILEGGIIAIKETSTPTAVADYGRVYCKSDNKLYFQDGAGSEHEISFA